jgi:NSS family neurotransmitter:Na+ symporter
MSYYFAVTGWTLGFAVESYLGSSRSFAEFTDSYTSLFYFFLALIVSALVVSKGVKTIEFLSKIMMPFLILIVILLAGYSLSLDSASRALSFLFKPDFPSLGNLNVWFLAFGQAFYSLAVGQGYLITYGSFLPKKVNLPRAAGWVALVETSIAMLAGVIIFPIVFSFGLDPQEGTQLAFTTLPLIFKSIPFGAYLAMAFFTLFFLAAISSCIAGMEVVKTAFREEFYLSHKKATFWAFLPVTPLGFLSALSFTPVGFSLFGRPFLEVLDLFAANQVVVASALIGGGIISWTVPKKSLIKGLDLKWRKPASLFINIFRFMPVLAFALLIISWVL